MWLNSSTDLIIIIMDQIIRTKCLLRPHRDAAWLGSADPIIIDQCIKTEIFAPFFWMQHGIFSTEPILFTLDLWKTFGLTVTNPSQQTTHYSHQD